MTAMHSKRRTPIVRGACAIALTIAVGLGCNTTPDLPPIEVETGPDATVTVDGLHKAHKSGYALLFVKPDADFASYNAVMFDPVQIAYKRKPKSRRYPSTDSNFALTQDQTARVKRMLREAFEKELAERALYGVTDVPGPTVLRLELQIVDLIVKVPTTPYSGREYNFTSSTADMTLMMELRDSLSGEILARVGDRREARQPGSGANQLYSSNPVTDTDAVRRVFRRWAQILALRLEAVKQVEPSESLEEGAPPAG